MNNCMGAMSDLFFGTAGTPTSSAKCDSNSGIKRIRELGFGCMELGFVRGIKMGTDTAIKIKATATEMGVALSVHAPYYICLLYTSDAADEEDSVDLGGRRIIK